MKRRSFFRSLLGAPVVAAVAPKITDSGAAVTCSRIQGRITVGRITADRIAGQLLVSINGVKRSIPYFE